MHIFGPVSQYPYGPRRSYKPPDALMPSYHNLCETVGTVRIVVVHPSVYGTDIRCSADVGLAMGPNARGECVTDMSASDAEIATLHVQGFRGVRFNFVSGGGTAVEKLDAMAARVAQASVRTRRTLFVATARYCC